MSSRLNSLQTWRQFRLAAAPRSSSFKSLCWVFVCFLFSGLLPMMIYACFSFLNSIFAQFFAHADKAPFLLPILKFPVTFLSSFKIFMLIYFMLHWQKWMSYSFASFLLQYDFINFQTGTSKFIRYSLWFLSLETWNSIKLQKQNSLIFCFLGHSKCMKA